MCCPPIDWAVDKDIQPYAYDLDAAKSLLEEAGWVDSNGDGIREKDGKEMKLSLMTNAGNTTREDIGVYVQDQLKQIGIDVDFQAIDFGTLLDQHGRPGLRHVHPGLDRPRQRSERRALLVV